MPPPLVVMILLPLNEKTPARAERAGRPAAVGGAQGLGGVLDQGDPVLVAQGGRARRSRRLPVEVDGDHGGREPARPGPAGQLLGHQVGVDGPVGRGAVDEDRAWPRGRSRRRRWPRR